MPDELIPREEELTIYEGLEEIRFRRDGQLAIGLFYRKYDEVPVVVLADEGVGDAPLVFDVAPADANQAFEEPYPYISETGQLLMQNVLAKPSPDTAQAA